jgi:hypothetical protein
VLSHDEHEIRANALGCDDVLAFTRFHDTWISEEIEPVTVTFEWQRDTRAPAASEDSCVCPKDLAARLIQSLLTGKDEEAEAETSCVFDPEESGAGQRELRLNEGVSGRVARRKRLPHLLLHLFRGGLL